MSLTTYIGNQGDILSEEAHRASIIRLARPVLTDEDLARLLVMEKPRVAVSCLPLAWTDDLESALETLRSDAVSAVRDGANVLLLSDRRTGRCRCRRCWRCRR